MSIKIHKAIEILSRYNNPNKIINRSLINFRRVMEKLENPH